MDRCIACVAALLLTGCTMSVRIGDAGPPDASSDAGAGVVGEADAAPETPPVEPEPDPAPSNACPAADGPEALPPDLDPAECAAPAAEPPEPALHFLLDGDLENVGTSSPPAAGESHGATFVPGRFGAAVLVSPEGHVVLPGTREVLTSSTTHTVSLWFRRTPRSNGGAPIVSCRSGYRGFETYTGSGSALYTCYGAGNGVQPGGCDSAPFCDDFWHNLLVRSESPSSDLEVFLDGRLHVTVPNEGLAIFEYTADLFLGEDPRHLPRSGGEWLVDDVRVYLEAFDDAQQCLDVIGGQWCRDRCFVERVM